MTELKDWLNSINFTKQNLIEEDPDAISKYPPYIVNRCLSGHLDCIMFANEMNKFPNLDKDLQYSFYLNTLRKKKRSYIKVVTYYTNKVSILLFISRSSLHLMENMLTLLLTMFNVEIVSLVFLQIGD